MTERKEKILTSATRLFAKRGFDNTPTSLIAKEAGVSEGLIFRHFGNKEKLLIAIIDDGEQRIRTHVASIVMETDPGTLLSRAIDLPITLIKNEKEYWTLQFNLKVQIEKVHAGIAKQDFMKPFMVAVQNAMKELGFEKPEFEALRLAFTLDGMSKALLEDVTDNDFTDFRNYLKSKYR